MTESFETVNGDKITGFFFDKLRYRLLLVLFVLHAIWIGFSLYYGTFFEFSLPEGLDPAIEVDEPFIEAYVGWILFFCQAAGIIFVIQFLETIPRTFNALEKREIISNIQNEDIQKKYVQFIKELKVRFNSKLQYILSLAFILGAFTPYIRDLITPVEELGFLSNVNPHFFPISYISAIILNTLIYLVFGTVFWKGLVLVRALRELGETVDFDVKPLHPDRSGGLKPIGELCLSINKIIFVFGFGLSLWFILPHPETSDTILQLYLAAYVLAGVFFFFYPLWTVHDAMRSQKASLLDEISSKINLAYKEAYKEIRKKKSPVDTAKLEGIQALDILYERADNMPVWPFDVDTLMKFFTTIALPFLLISLDWIIRSLRGT
jgi:hypothetical protein